MSEPKTAPEETRWTRYRHRERHQERRHKNSQKPEIEYEAETLVQWPDDFDGHDSSLGTRPISMLMKYFVSGEKCYRIRTVRNISLQEDVHQPAFTMMPAEGFLDVYIRADQEVANT